ncbi:MAG: cytochrome b [Marinobacter sp.]|nr:cytochrome b [Marinobacter sp.]
MQIRNTSASYGVVAIFLHWLVALAVFGLFALGFWMVDLTYYHDWYKRAPDIHRSIGILLLAVMVFRVVWRAVTVSPSAPSGHRRWEVRSAHLAHGLLYVLIFVAMASGYLISTADGSSISVFGWFEVPSVTGQIKGMEEPAGTVHYWTTWSIIVLALIHAAGALKHHFIDRDNTLRRMLGK